MASLPESIGIPASNDIVNVKAMDAGRISSASSAFVWGPVLQGHEKFSTMSYSFLIQNDARRKCILFDLGIRKDPENYAPVISEMLKNGIVLDVEKDVATQLQEGGIDLNSIDAIVWSHSHLDHIGDPSTFPRSTELVVGPGSKEALLPSYPENPQSVVLATDFEGRTVTELGDNDFTLDIGGFKAHDYFKDGSFYLLNVPGHAIGHMAGLARVTPNTFVVLGGDTCHHAGMLRPNKTIHKYFPCPGHLVSDAISNSHFPVESGSTDMSSRTRPLLHPKATNYADLEQSKASIETLAENFDAHPDIFVVLAHDTSLEGVIDLFPGSLNDWQEKGWKERVMWSFLEEGPTSVFKPKTL